MLASVADTAIVPLQDLLGLGNEARMNLPNSSQGNWTWRFQDAALTEAHADRLDDGGHGAGGAHHRARAGCCSEVALDVLDLLRREFFRVTLRRLAGFTQIDFLGSPTNNSMLFLKPATTKQEFITGLSTAASTTQGATYVTLNNHGQPTTAKAGIAFPGNDWIAFHAGDQYLAKLGNPSPQLLSALAGLRQRHLQAVADLLDAIEKGKVNLYLNNQFRCPTH